jgi:hypothetical protein
MWVLQEVAVARNIGAMCGDDIMPWYKLTNAIMFMFYPEIPAAQSYIGIDSIMQIIKLRDLKK